jgi:hypothetical protein
MGPCRLVQDVLRAAPQPSHPRITCRPACHWSLGRKQDALGAAHAGPATRIRNRLKSPPSLGNSTSTSACPNSPCPPAARCRGAAHLPCMRRTSCWGAAIWKWTRAIAPCRISKPRSRQLPAPAEKEGVNQTVQLAECLYAINESARADALLDTMIASAGDAPPFWSCAGSMPASRCRRGLVARLALWRRSEALPASERANAFLAMGRCLDNQGRHVDAFDLWAKARALLKIEHHSAEKLRIQNFQARGLYAGTDPACGAYWATRQRVPSSSSACRVPARRSRRR